MPERTDTAPADSLALRRERRRRAALRRGTYREYGRFARFVTHEITAGLILLAATVAALVLANSPLSDLYVGVRDTHLGFDIGSFHLDLTLGHWAADGLLAVFFFLAGLELKSEFVTGELRSPGRALVPVVAAAGGVAAPALIFTAINLAGPDGALAGWAIPAATDIAFALAVLALLGSHLPTAIRTFLLTLAIVDDLIAIVIIAIFYTDELRLGYLALALVPIILYRLVATRGEGLLTLSPAAAWLLMLPLGAITWALFLNSGIHATIAGVVLAFMVPVRPRALPSGRHSLAGTFEHRFRPLSSGFAVPVFAFLSAGVAIGGAQGLSEALGSTVAIGIVVGLVGGKIIGIMGATFLVTRLPGAHLDPAIRWGDLLGMSALAGIGFTVSLLMTELSYDASDPMQAWGKIGVLTASAVTTVLGAIIILPRDRRYRREQQSADGQRPADEQQSADGQRA